MTRKPIGDGIDDTALTRLVGYNCRRAYNAILKNAKTPITNRNLPRGAFAMLVLLYHNPGLSSLQVCKTLGVQPPNLVSLVANLESAGMIERQANKSDSRSIDLCLTPTGRRLVAGMEQSVKKADLEATAMLSDAERHILVELLSRIYKRTDVGIETVKTARTKSV